ncbi:ARP2/3 actin-organizing complex subunit Sop2 [Tilletia horrida]|uniref:Arp2/3 complex 41 kDa subunit n=1 Tax=Tilletia horrida TaxID=155126 RepID=A0AAN6GEJ8_9BASI|nr:ARP2/3 actin-organizing complex subunit Sop2 [Tilletia horrida]
MATQVHHLSLGPLTAHAFNGDRTQVAVSPNSNEVHIYTLTPGADPSQPPTWTLAHTLAEHDKLVTGIDWAPHSNRLVTCAQDRNAYVWTFSPSENVWKPTLVLLRLNRAATFVRWSPQEDKFAVASGAKLIAICSFETEQDWWVAKHIKKPIRSTVLSLDWHPNNVLLAAGSADMRARVFSAFIKGVDQKPPPSVWGERLPFGTVCGDWPTPAGGWVHGVAFSPSGDVLAYVGHDSSLTIVYPSGPDAPPHAIHSIRSPTLPHVSLTFTSETSLVAAGHDCQPVLFEGDVQNGWRLTKTLDSASAAASKPAPPPPPPGKPAALSAGAGAGAAAGVGRLNNEAFNRFRSADVRGSSGSAGAGAPLSPSAAGSGVSTASTTPSSTSAAAGAKSTAASLGALTGSNIGADGELHTTHQNTITSVRLFGSGSAAGSGAGRTTVSTSAVDGRLCVWNVPTGGPAGGASIAGLATAVQSIRIA